MPSWICREFVAVEVNRPAAEFRAPLESKMSVLSGNVGTWKFV